MGSNFTSVITLQIMMRSFAMFNFLTVVVYIFIPDQWNCFIYDIVFAAQTQVNLRQIREFILNTGKGQHIVHRLCDGHRPSSHSLTLTGLLGEVVKVGEETRRLAGPTN